MVLNHPAIVDGENYNVEIKIKKTPVENKFYIHNMNLQNKNETVSLNAKDKESRGYNSYDLSRIDNIANNASNVNNNETKFSLDIPIEETKELVAIHNTTESKLLSALELGGLPSPSIAIMKAQNISANNEFGDISLVLIKRLLTHKKVMQIRFILLTLILRYRLKPNTNLMKRKHGIYIAK